MHPRLASHLNNIQSQNPIDIYFDYEYTNGFFKPFSEINCGPLPNHDINGVDLTNQYTIVSLFWIKNRFGWFLPTSQRYF